MKHILFSSMDRTRAYDENDKNIKDTEIKCGCLRVSQNHGGKNRSVSVFIRLYRSSFEQYVILYRDQKYSVHSGFISLKNCSVSISDYQKTQFKVTNNNCEGVGLSFEADSHSEAADWVEALQNQTVSSARSKFSPLRILSPNISKSPSMPTLEEKCEE